MKIIVRVENMLETTQIKIDYDNNKLMYNGNLLNMDAKAFSARLLAIIHFWPERLETPGILDGEQYSIKINHNNEIKEYVGINNFPDNYFQFKNLLKEVANEHSRAIS